MGAEDKYAVWLSSIEEVGAARYRKLCEVYGSPQNVFENISREMLSRLGCSDKAAESILRARVLSRVDENMAILQKLGISYMLMDDPAYPARLKEIADPPPVLYCKGQLPLQLEKAIAVVGTRHATRYGCKVARRLGRELAEAGVTVVSGMAAGIDGEAERGSIEGGGYSVAVLGCGVERVYPMSNRDVYAETLEHGALVSEYFPGSQTLPHHFPARNRIISGLSHGVVVVESPAKGGSLITTEFALEQGRDVFAVPGNVDSPASEGTLQLIREGCVPISCAAHILEAYPQWGYQTETTQAAVRPAPMPEDLTATERTIYSMLEAGELHSDYLSVHTGIPQAELAACLTMMELRGIINKLPGGSYEINRG